MLPDTCVVFLQVSHCDALETWLRTPNTWGARAGPWLWTRAGPLRGPEGGDAAGVVRAAP